MQTSKADIMEHVLKPIMSFYSAPRAMEDKEGAVALYLKALAPYPLEALQGAMTAIVASHDRTTWPLPSEIIKATRDWIHSNIKQPHTDEPKKDRMYELRRQAAEIANRFYREKKAIYQPVIDHGYGAYLCSWVERESWLAAQRGDESIYLPQEWLTKVLGWKLHPNPPDLHMSVHGYAIAI